MFILDAVKLAVIQQFRMKECDIFRGVKTNSDPSYIFSGGSGPQRPPASTPLMEVDSVITVTFLESSIFSYLFSFFFCTLFDMSVS